MSKKVLITGKNGQLGQHLIKYFQENTSHNIIATQRHKSYENQPVIFDKERAKTELLDLTDASSINEIIKKYKPDYIFNTAANAFVGESWKVPYQHFEINALGVVRFLEAIKNHSPNSRFLNLGTSEEFACVIEGRKQSQDENTKISPRSPYGCSKAAARYMVEVYRESYNLHVIQPWTFNFESEIRGEKYLTRKVSMGVARIAKALKNGTEFSPIELGNLNSYRSWQHASDVADALWKIINQNGEPKDWKPYVISSHETHSIKDFVEASFGVLNINGYWEGEGLDEKYIHDLTGKILVDVNKKYFRPLDVTFLWGDSSKIRKELNWEPKINFEKLVEKMTINDYNLLS